MKEENQRTKKKETKKQGRKNENQSTKKKEMKKE